MAFDYIVSGPPIIPAPTQPSLLFDKTNDRIYVSTMPSLSNSPAWVAVGGSGTPGGLNTQLQFNDGGNFGGDPNFTFDKNTTTITFPNGMDWTPLGAKNMECYTEPGSGSALVVSGIGNYALSTNLIIVEAAYNGLIDFSGGAPIAVNFGNVSAHAVSNTLGFDIACVNTGGGTLTGCIAIDITPGGTNFTGVNVEAADSTGTPFAAQGGVSYFRDGYRMVSTSGPKTSGGSGTPEGAVTAPIGSIFVRTDGGTSSSIYLKESGAGNTGWKGGMVGSTDEASSLSSYMLTDAGIAASQNQIVMINRTNPGLNIKRKGLNVYLETAANFAGNTDGLQVNVGVTVDATTIAGSNHVDGMESAVFVSGNAVTLAQINGVKARVSLVSNAHVQNAVSFLSYLPSVPTGATVDNLIGLELDTPAGGGTVTNFIGVNASLNTAGVIGVTTAFGGVFGGGSSGTRRAGILMDTSGSGVVGGSIAFGSTAAIACAIYSGTGSPESVVTAGIGSLFLRQDGGAGTTLYVKESGTGNTGWIAK